MINHVYIILEELISYTYHFASILRHGTSRWPTAVPMSRRPRTVSSCTCDYVYTFGRLISHGATTTMTVYDQWHSEQQQCTRSEIRGKLYIIVKSWRWKSACNNAIINVSKKNPPPPFKKI